ncbi:MAG: delta-60 repeat domain-containing protein [Actinomycetota bacterium]
METRIGAARVMVAIAAAAALMTAQMLPAWAADGDLDPSFDGDGKVTTAFAGGAAARAVAVQSDGGIVAAGVAGSDFGLARYGTEGALDPAFGSGGKVTTSIIGAGEARAVALQPDGMIVAAGTADDRNRFAVVRYDTGGTPDPGFGTGGVVTTDLTPGFDIANGVAIQPDGKILVAGSAGTNRPKFALVRYGTDGTPDPTFGDGGLVITPYGIWGVARALALQSNGKIVLAGGNGGSWALARYTPEGELDPVFGGDGKVTSPLFGDAFAVAVQSDGRIVAAGAFDFFRFAAARFTKAGRPDRTFSGDGRVTTDVRHGSEQVAEAVAIQHDGRIVVAGGAGPHEVVEPIEWRFAIVRYRANGVLDHGFGGDGRATTRFVGGAYAHGASLSGGRLLVVGGAGPGNAGRFALARYRV